MCQWDACTVAAALFSKVLNEWAAVFARKTKIQTFSGSFKGVLPVEFQHRLPKARTSLAHLKRRRIGRKWAATWLLKVDCRHQCKMYSQKLKTWQQLQTATASWTQSQSTWGRRQKGCQQEKSGTFLITEPTEMDNQPTYQSQWRCGCNAAISTVTIRLQPI